MDKQLQWRQDMDSDESIEEIGGKAMAPRCNE